MIRNYSGVYKVTLTLFCLILSVLMSQTKIAELLLGSEHSALALVTRSLKQTPRFSYEPSCRMGTIAKPVLDTAEISSLTLSPCRKPSIGITAGLCPGSTTTSVCDLTFQFVAKSSNTKAKAFIVLLSVMNLPRGSEIIHHG